MKIQTRFCRILLCLLLASASHGAYAKSNCNQLPKHAELQSALDAANDMIDLVLNNEMWGVIVDESGIVCAVAFTGENALQSQWLASRVIAAQKANTANSLSLGNNNGGRNKGLALSSANLWAAVQPGGSLYGLQFSNPVDVRFAYRGNRSRFGLKTDPMVGQRVGGINVFGGGLALYDYEGNRVGGVGVSGDTSCRDHMVAWETRHNLGLDYVQAGVSTGSRLDNIIFDVDNPFGHPNCLAAEGFEEDAANNLTPVPSGL